MMADKKEKEKEMEILRMNLETEGTLVTATVENIGGVFSLTWTEGINVWEESFPALSYALARFAALAYCAETNWVDGFIHSPEEFVTAFDKVTGK